ncbi:CCA tRNA nucleotidyltransferase [Hwanghaeella grinnelliae]|uniref:CCA tRNA nucleotidyltransferase n=1 Tax=Hwanghaeella grinnelliae TaxID=2500179 RepID=A0A437QMZ3_9PROT|nr:CCA tRNA nucleotidyltransferase [Hwanghaeella grinnelliae]RVU35882.1 CCA tRNA nucleotidyltransferase [Hwanghaeella grinnelliae]
MQIAVQDWMRSPGVIAVFDALSDGVTRFVGGCVRDSILGRPIRDIDIATDLEPKSVMAHAGQAGIKAVPTGIEHGTVTLVAKGTPVEVTTLRRDVETDGRRAVVAFTRDWREDAMRRDFTMNALSMDPDGTIHDYFGGIEDARAGRVRFVGAAEMRIREDVLRILRFFRFHAFYGKDDPDAEGYAACVKLAHLLPSLSGERIRQELLRLLEADDPLPALEMMSDAGIWPEIGIAAVDLAALAAFIRLEGGATDPITRLAALLAPDADTGEIASKLRLSGREATLLRNIRKLAQDNPPAPGEIGRYLYRNGAEMSWGAGHLAIARGIDAKSWEAVVAVAEEWQPKTFPLRGRDLLDAGMAPGAEVGALLGSIENWWIDQGFEPDLAACLDHAQSLMPKT